MSERTKEIRLEYIPGLQEIVMQEMRTHGDIRVIRQERDAIYAAYISDLSRIKNFRSVLRASLSVRDPRFHPTYLANHKGIIGELVQEIIAADKKAFKTFKITCAGSDSEEVRAIREYIAETYALTEDEEADLKILIAKRGETWEVSAQITPRPLASRAYRVRNMGAGAMDPTIAYALNALCDLEHAKSYLNAFSGSATLLIEAGQCFPNLTTLVGFDHEKEHLSIAMQNVKAAGLIRRIKLFERDVRDLPGLGTFDVITADLPFGMAIAKGEDLEALYSDFLKCCEKSLAPGGRVGMYTSEHELLSRMMKKSKLKITKEVDIKIFTNSNRYLYPKILIGERKER